MPAHLRQTLARRALCLVLSAIFLLGSALPQFADLVPHASFSLPAAPAATPAREKAPTYIWGSLATILLPRDQSPFAPVDTLQNLFDLQRAPRPTGSMARSLPALVVVLVLFGAGLIQ